jgi:hypothetical protein
MNIKTEKKTQTEHERPPVPSPEEIRAAYESHTLAQMLYAQIAAHRPWLLQTTTPAASVVPGFDRTPSSWIWSGSG